MSTVFIVVVQVGGQPIGKLFGRGEVATFQKTSSQGAEPEFDLVEPGAVLGSEMEHVLVFGVGQESPPLRAGA